ncbi:MAG: hypothetical protein VKK97_09600 [Synechococcaceae cyanobacterium]|nr:hypothetical protein [Synechococcaceae cyanobacterium]
MAAADDGFAAGEVAGRPGGNGGNGGSAPAGSGAGGAWAGGAWAGSGGSGGGLAAAGAADGGDAVAEAGALPGGSLRGGSRAGSGCSAGIAQSGAGGCCRGSGASWASQSDGPRRVEAAAPPPGTPAAAADRAPPSQADPAPRAIRPSQRSRPGHPARWPQGGIGPPERPARRRMAVGQASSNGHRAMGALLKMPNRSASAAVLADPVATAQALPHAGASDAAPPQARRGR